MGYGIQFPIIRAESPTPIGLWGQCYGGSKLAGTVPDQPVLIQVGQDFLNIFVLQLICCTGPDSLVGTLVLLVSA